MHEEHRTASITLLSYIASLLECFSFLQIYTRSDKQVDRLCTSKHTHHQTLRARALTHARGSTHTHTHTRARARTHTQAHTHTHSHIHAHTHASTHARTYTHTHTVTHTHAHTHTHARTHNTHTHLDAVPAQSDFLSTPDLPESGVASSAAEVPTTVTSGPLVRQ